MNKIPEDMKAGTIHSSKNYGDVEVLEYVTAHNVTVLFKETGSITTTRANAIRQGSIKDKAKPTCQGTGFIGDGLYPAKVRGRHTLAYQTWRDMFKRCYSEKLHELMPTYKDCTVAPIWHNFQNFAAWFYQNHVDGYQLDKDIKVSGNKIYSPETCLFVSGKDNAEEANAKHYRFISPSGENVEVYNLSEFCANNKLTRCLMTNLHLGRREEYKGWRLNVS